MCKDLLIAIIQASFSQSMCTKEHGDKERMELNPAGTIQLHSYSTLFYLHFINMEQSI